MLGILVKNRQAQNLILTRNLEDSEVIVHLFEHRKILISNQYK